MNRQTRRLAYLSGAPRVSTSPDAVLSGPRTHVMGVIRGFEQLGWEVKPFIVGDKVPRHWVVEERTEDALRASYVKRVVADILRIQMGVLNGWRAQGELRAVDWVYERFGAFQMLGRWFQRRGIPWILETNALLYREAVQDRNTIALSKLLRAFEQEAYRRCDVLICVSQALADIVISETGVRPEKVVVLPNGVDTTHFDPERHKGKRFFRQSTLGFVGHLSTWQRLDLLIEALAELRSEGVDINLVVVGEGPMRVAWEEFSRSLGQADYIRFLGRVPWTEVPAYIAGFDLGYAGAVPLSSGSMYLSPLKLYEYMAMAKPVIASAYEDARTVIRAGETGYLFQPEDKQDLKRALRTALNTRESWPEIGKKARIEVVNRHSWTARIQDAIPKIETILEKKYGKPYLAGSRG